MAVGQLWADNDSREFTKGTRQRLRVVGISRDASRVHLNNEDTGRDSWVLRRRMTSGHAYLLVSDV